jgi:hypothetical protein
MWAMLPQSFMLTARARQWDFVLALALAACSCDGQGGITNEGSLAAPTPLVIGQEHAATVAAGGQSYYVFTPTQTRLHTVRLAAIDGGTLFVQNDAPGVPKFEGSLFAYGTGDVGGSNAFPVTTAFDCIADAAAGEPLVFSVSNAKVTYVEGGSSRVADTRFRLSVFIDEASNSQGSAESPIMVPVGSPVAGSVDTNGVSYYAFVATAASHLVAVTSAYPTIFFELAVVGPDGVELPCQLGTLGKCEGLATVPGQTYMVLVHAGMNAGLEANFTLTVAAR